jgi:two-component system sensor histidine kinase PhoQ
MPSFKPTSLSARLLLANLLVLPLFTGLSGYLLDVTFQRSLLAGERERLNANVYLLLAAAESREGWLELPDDLTDPRFTQPDSGLYGYIHDDRGNEVWRSASAALISPLPAQQRPLQPGHAEFGALVADSAGYYRFEYDIAWESEDGGRHLYRFSILHTQAEAAGELAAYRRQLWWLLGGLALVMLCMQGLVMRWGLKPLQTLAARLRALEKGEATGVEGDYPLEIRPVISNLNRVLQSERTQRERYRNTLADLAHSLKTPLAVLRGSAGRTPDIDEQIMRMDQIISHQLQRAVTRAPQQPDKPVVVATVIERIATALHKVYAARNIDFEIDAHTNVRFHGVETDLLELLGNILENAFKYGRGRVRATATADAAALTLIVEDDGPGVPAHRQQQILQRGARADTAQPGQGIGLAVAVDIVSAYRGSLTVGKSTELGGAEFRIILPRGQGPG